jgi:hypothetical protein
MAVNQFSHSGDIGDIIYALPAIKALGGGKLVLFHHPDGRTAHGMNEAKVARLRPLLESQDYIDSVEWSEEVLDHSLNGFRDHWQEGVLTDMHLSTQGLSWEHRVEPWLHAEPKHVAPVVMHRSARYLGNFPWAKAVEVYKKDAVFVGFPDEHAVFCNSFGEIPFYDAKDFLELAMVIAGSQWYLGNQSSPLAVAHGLKHNVMTEVCPGGLNQHHCIFQRANSIIVWDHKVEWPKLS